jgi:hypothetical protein
MTAAQPVRRDSAEELRLHNDQLLREQLSSENNLSATLYLDLMKKRLTRLTFPGKFAPIRPQKTLPRRMRNSLARLWRPLARGAEVARFLRDLSSRKKLFHLAGTTLVVYDPALWTEWFAKM